MNQAYTIALLIHAKTHNSQ